MKSEHKALFIYQLCIIADKKYIFKTDKAINQLVPKCICDIITVPNRLAHSGNEYK